MWRDTIARQSATALTELETEYQRTVAESRAFADFHGRVKGLKTAPLQTDGGAQQVISFSQHQRTTMAPQCEHVRHAYRETVLSMPHYTDEYDESLKEHMAAEFGQDIVVNILGKTDFSDHLKQALLDASRRSRKQREELLTKLDAEADALETAHETLTDIGDALQEFNTRPLGDYTLEELCDVRQRVNEFTADIERLAADRQTSIHADNWSSTNTQREIGLQSYLYQELDTTYPILHDIAECCQLLQEAHTNIETEIIMSGGSC